MLRSLFDGSDGCYTGIFSRYSYHCSDSRETGFEGINCSCVCEMVSCGKQPMFPTDGALLQKFQLQYDAPIGRRDRRTLNRMGLSDAKCFLFCPCERKLLKGSN